MCSYGWYSFLAGNSHHTPSVENKSWLPYRVQLWNLFVCCLFDVRLNFIYQGHKEQFLCAVKQYMIHTEAIYAMYNQVAVGEWFRKKCWRGSYWIHIHFRHTICLIKWSSWLPLAGNCLNHPKSMMCTFPGFVSDGLALSPQRPQHSVGFLCGPQRPLVIFEGFFVRHHNISVFDQKGREIDIVKHSDGCCLLFWFGW